MVLRKVVDILGLSKSWGISPKDAVNRLRESLILTADRSKGTIRIKLKGFITKDAAMIINTICEQIPKNQENISDPTPVISFTPDGFDLDKHPDRFPLSENAQTNQTKVIVIRKAE
jgi:hypothetical protein